MRRLLTGCLLIVALALGGIAEVQDDIDHPGYWLAYRNDCTVKLITVPAIITSEVASITGDCDGPGVYLDEEADLIFFDYGNYITGGYRDTPWGRFISERFRIGHPIVISEDGQRVTALYNTFAYQDTDDSDGLTDTFNLQFYRAEDVTDMKTEPTDITVSLILRSPIAQAWLPDGETLVLLARQTIDGPDVMALVDSTTGEITWLHEDRYISPTRYGPIFGQQQVRIWEGGYARLYTVGEDEEPYAWSSTRSPDGRWLAFWVQDQSSGIHVLHLFDTETGEDQEIASTHDSRPPTVPYWLMPPRDSTVHRAD